MGKDWECGKKRLDCVAGPMVLSREAGKQISRILTDVRVKAVKQT